MRKSVKIAVGVAALIVAYLLWTHYAHAAVPQHTTVQKVQTAQTANFSGASVGVDVTALSLENTATSTDTKYFGDDLAGYGRIGYGYQNTQGWFLGGELSDGTRTGVTRNIGAKDSTGNEFAADVRAGKVISNNLLYGKVGYALTDVTEENSVDGAKNSATFNGLRLGGGVERFLSDKVTGRVEVIYTDYSARTLDNNQVDPSNVAAKVGFSYQLD